MEPTEQLEVIVPALIDLVDRVEATDLDNATPCEHFTLHDVLDHMIVLGGTFAHLFRGEAPPAATAPETGGRVPAAEFRKVMDDLLDAVRSEGALERTIEAPVGTLPGETFARLVALDGLVHGYDIARSAGLRWELPDDVVDAVDRFAWVAITLEMRDGDTFKDPVRPPDGATGIERVVAFTGRTV